MNILLEDKKIDSEYEKNWSDIERETFDKIIVLDPVTNVEQDRIGPSAKQLLLPRFINGETDFINDEETVKNCLETYNKNRSTYPAVLRNIANFPSIKDFIDYILHGDESEFAKTHDFTELKKDEKESPLDKIYNKFYSDIKRDDFDQIIKLDSKTTDSSIGEVAKNLLLPKFKTGEDFLKNPEKVEKAISYFYDDRANYPADRKDLGKYSSVSDFIDFVLSGGESSFMSYMNSKVKEGELSPDSFTLLASTKDYDVIQPHSWEANSYIVGKPNPTSGSYDLRWCTGYGTNDSYWNNYRSYGPIVCFIWKNDPKNRDKCFQINLRDSNSEIVAFLDGYDRNPFKGEYSDAFEQFLLINPDLIDALKDNNIFRKCSAFEKALNKYETMTKPLEYYDTKDLIKLIKLDILKLLKEVNIHSDTVPAGTFEGCVSLKKVNFDDSVIKIGVQAFFNCSNLEKLELPKNLIEIGAEAFAGCTSLSGSIRLPDSLEKIGRGAFRGTHCKLSINKNRENKLSISPEDREWFASHAKGITVQEDLNEDIITENIPRDLAAAYARSNPAAKGIQSHPESEHSEIGSAYRRRKIKYDYFRSNYEELSKQEAIDYLGLTVQIPKDEAGNPILDENGKLSGIKVKTSNRELFNERISTLRFIINGKVVEYEVRAGNVLYLAYYLSIPLSYFGQYPLFKGKEGETTDVRFANKYSDIYTIIQISDKIYKTDEYEHLITPETKTGKKIKVFRTDAEGNILTDEAGNVLYDIVDDTIENRRTRAKVLKQIKSYIPVGHSKHELHHPGRNFGGPELDKFNVTISDIPDTGSHLINNRYPTIRSFKDSSYYVTYVRALQKKKELFNTYDYLRQVVKKLEKEQDLYSEEEYATLHDSLVSRKEEAYKDYLELTSIIRSLKDKIILSIDDITEKYNKRLASNLILIDNLKNKEYDLYNRLTKLEVQSVGETSARLKEINKKLTKLQNSIAEYEIKNKSLMDQIAQLQKALEQNAISIDEAVATIAELKSKVDTISEEDIKEKFRQVDELKAEMKDLQNQINNIVNKGSDKEENKKEIDPSLSDIISFEDITSETTPDEGTESV